MNRYLFSAAAAAGLALLACRGAAQREGGGDPLARAVDSLRAPVERATGLRFKRPPKSALRSREQVRAYLVRKLEEELPPAKLAGLETAYRLFGLLPDTLDLRGLLLDLYTEQIAGYYDPDSAMLFGVAGADPLQLRVVVAHELVHALQGQHLSLDSILEQKGDNDRLTAAQAVLEGQATYASIRALVPGEQDPTANPEFWSLYREQIREQQTAMPVFARAPLVLRESFLFPYLAGAEFMRWWQTSPYADTVPFGVRMPVSSEQILYPDRYVRGDRPVRLAFEGGSDTLYEDVLGENEIRVLLAHVRGVNEVQTLVPIGWGGDRYRVYRSPEGPALVWYAVWDDTTAAQRFMRVAAKLGTTARPNYRALVERLELSGHPATQYVLAPEAWPLWRELPMARVDDTARR
jgi:hypothetical protein